MKWTSHCHLKVLSFALCLVGFTFPLFALAQEHDVIHTTQADIVDWLLNGFFLSLFVMIVLMHQTTQVLAKGVKPEIKAKYGRYSGAIAMLFDDAIQDQYIKKRDQLKMYVRLAGLVSVILFLSIFLFKM